MRRFRRGLLAQAGRRPAVSHRVCQALTEAGYLSVLIPEEYGGSGLPLGAACAVLEEIHRSGGNGGACHAQMYTMGTLLRHGSDEQKRQFLPDIAAGALRLQAFGVTEPTSGTDTSRIRTTAVRDGDHYVVNGQKVFISRTEHSDLMVLLVRTSPRPESGSHTDGMSVLLVDMREALGNGLTIRPIDTMMNHATTELFFDDLRVPAKNLIGEEGQGFRCILDGMNAERILIAAECIGDARWFTAKSSSYACEREVFGRPIGAEPGSAVSYRPGAYPDGGSGADGAAGSGPVRRGQACRRRGQYGQAAGVRGGLGGGGYLYPDARRLRVCRGVRRGAQVSRDPPVPGGACLHQPDPVLCRHP